MYRIMYLLSPYGHAFACRSSSRVAYHRIITLVYMYYTNYLYIIDTIQSVHVMDYMAYV